MGDLRDMFVLKEITLMNLRRIFFISLLAVPISISHIVIFGMNLPASTGVEFDWRIGIIASHSIMATLIAISGFLSYFLSKKTKVTLFMKILEYFAITLVFVIGIVIVVLDQLVTASITPFMIACIFIGVLFLIRPLFAVIIYMLGYISFHIALGLTQSDQAILLSNRVNGITVVGIGLFLSIVLWKVNMANIIQKNQIDEQQKELLEKNKELEKLAFYDQLTGVYNRRKLEEILNNEIEMIKRDSHESCIVLVDIDSFKEINDNYGHPVGDLVLQETAGLLRNNIRRTDFVARWGGDEFMILFPNTSLEDGIMLAEKLRALFSNKELTVKETVIKITASFGISPLRGDFLEIAYKSVDVALYRAKEKGSNRVETVSV